MFGVETWVDQDQEGRVTKTREKELGVSENKMRQRQKYRKGGK